MQLGTTCVVLMGSPEIATKTELGVVEQGAGGRLPWGTTLPASWHIFALVLDARQPLVFGLKELLVGPECASTASTYTSSRSHLVS